MFHDDYPNCTPVAVACRRCGRISVPGGPVPPQHAHPLVEKERSGVGFGVGVGVGVGGIILSLKMIPTPA